jgi:hypothetical protein
MKRLLIGLAATGLFGGALACDLQQDTSADASPNMSKAPVAVACSGDNCGAKPASPTSKKATAKKTTVKPVVLALP